MRLPEDLERLKVRLATPRLPLHAHAQHVHVHRHAHTGPACVLAPPLVCRCSTQRPTPFPRLPSPTLAFSRLLSPSLAFSQVLYAKAEADCQEAVEKRAEAEADVPEQLDANQHAPRACIHVYMCILMCMACARACAWHRACRCARTCRSTRRRASGRRRAPREATAGRAARRRAEWPASPVSRPRTSPAATASSARSSMHSPCMYTCPCASSCVWHVHCMCMRTGELYDFDGPRGVSPSSEHGRTLAQGYAAAVAFVDVQVGRP